MPEPDHELSRRELIVSSAFVPLAALTATAQAAETALTPAQLKTLEAFDERLIPRDELGPSAAEASAQVYIDRAHPRRQARRQTFASPRHWGRRAPSPAS